MRRSIFLASRWLFHRATRCAVIFAPGSMGSSSETFRSRNPDGRGLYLKPARRPCALGNKGGIPLPPAGRLGENEFARNSVSIDPRLKGEIAREASGDRVWVCGIGFGKLPG